MPNSGNDLEDAAHELVDEDIGLEDAAIDESILPGVPVDEEQGLPSGVAR